MGRITGLMSSMALAIREVDTAGDAPKSGSWFAIRCGDS
jgi:hypothetical protein